MNQTKTAGRVTIIGLYAAVLIPALFLLFYNLDGRLLWGDEAETAVLAKNVVRYGVPRTMDGHNHITLYGGNIDENQQHIWTWSPWLQEYVAAGSFLVFGPTTWASRAPFALIAWAGLILLAWTAHRIYRSHRISLGSVLLLGTSEIFLLHARQCRYYSISIFCQILLLYGIHQLLLRDKKSIWTIAAALILQFYSNYMIAAANVPVLLLIGWLLYQRKDSSALWIVRSLLVLAVAALPWLLYAKPWKQPGMIGGVNLLGNLKYGVSEFHFHFLPLVIFLLPLPSTIIRILSKRRANVVATTAHTNAQGQSELRSESITPLERWLLWLLCLYFGFFLIMPGASLRYLLAVLPVACLLGSAWIFRYIRPSAAAYVIIALQCLTNVIAVATAYPLRGTHAFRSPIIDFVRGNVSPYINRTTEVVNFLNREAKPDDTLVVADPEFPLIFHTPLRIVDARFHHAGSADALPEWILPESPSSLLFGKPLEISGGLDQHYEPIVISVPDSHPTGVLPEPDAHQYYTASNRVPFTLYRKRGAPAR